MRGKITDFSNLEEKELKQIAKKFGIEDIFHTDYLEQGQVNDNYLLKNPDGQYVCTIFGEKNYKKVHNLVSLLDHLEKNQFKSSKIVKKYRDIEQYEERFVIMKEFIEGKILDDLDEDKLKKLGEKISLLHEIQPPDGIPNTYPYGIDFFRRVRFYELKDQDYIKWLSEKKKILQNNISQDLPIGLIHGDLFIDNLVWQNDDSVVFIDFEEACKYYKIFDLGKAIIGNCIEGENINFEKVKALIEGYQPKGKLNATEREQLKLFTEYAAVGTSYLRYQLEGKIPGGKQRDFEEMVRIADNIHSTTQKDFVENTGILHLHNLSI